MNFQFVIPDLEEQIIKDVKWLSFEEVLQKEEGRFARVLSEILPTFDIWFRNDKEFVAR